MAFCEKSFTIFDETVLGGTDGAPTQTTIRQRFYATADAVATVETAGYFNAARARLTKGDVLVAVMVALGTPVLKQYVFTAVPASGNVTIALQTTT